MMSKSLYDITQDYVKQNIDIYKENALKIHSHPETSNHEFKSSKILADQLEKEGFSVKFDVAGHRTGFDARYKSQKPGPTLVFLAEYDALANLGHGCGHNLFGNYSSLAAVAVKQVLDETGGEIRVYGTPGEEGGENGSAKESFVREGFFADVDAALCVHPSSYVSRTNHALANDPVDIEFFGKSSHAAGNPEGGVSALTPLIQTFIGIDAYRLRIHDDVSIHGVILDGGKAANVIPDYTRGRFYIRAKNRKKLDEIREDIKRIAEGQAISTGTQLKFGLFQNKVDDMILTPRFDDLFFKNAEKVGIRLEDIHQPTNEGLGSSDVGNVSHVVPTIQPTVSISDKTIPPHSLEFVEAAKSEKGLASIEQASTLLAWTAIDLLTDDDELNAIKKEHAKNQLVD